MSGETSFAGAFFVVPGIGMKRSFLWRLTRAATSSFVVVCGFNCATSCQRVSLPGGGAAIDVAVLDFEEGFGAQAGEKLADARLHAGLRERLLDLAADLFEARLAGLEALVDAQDDEALAVLNGSVT